jgi:hypothetical protein
MVSAWREVLARSWPQDRNDSYRPPRNTPRQKRRMDGKGRWRTILGLTRDDGNSEDSRRAAGLPLFELRTGAADAQTAAASAAFNLLNSAAALVGLWLNVTSLPFTPPLSRGSGAWRGNRCLPRRQKVATNGIAIRTRFSPGRRRRSHVGISVNPRR